MIQRFCFLFLTVLTLFLPSLGLAQEAMRLSEKEVLRLALEKNFGIRVSQIEPEKAKMDVRQAQGLFDTQLDLSGGYLIDKREQLIPIFGTDTRTAQVDLGLSRIFATGTRTSFDWGNVRTRTNSAFSVLNPAYENSFNFSLRQPLLQNSFGYLDRGTVRLARLGADVTRLTADRRVQERLLVILTHYWRWRVDDDNRAVTQKSLQEAKTFEQTSLKKKEIGLFDDVDVYASRANRLQMESEHEESLRLVRNSEDQLRLDLDLATNTSLSAQEPLMPASKELSFSEALVAERIQRAMTTRTDYQAVQKEVVLREVQVSLNKNKLYPSLDLVGSLRLNGIESALNDSLSDSQHPAYHVGGEFKFPLENRSARGQKERSVLEKRQTLLRLEELEKSIVQEVTTQSRDVMARFKQAQLQNEIQELQRKKWQKELEKFQNGLSSSDLVIRYQEDFLRSRRLALSALLQLRAALLSLRLSENSLIPEAL